MGKLREDGKKPQPFSGFEHNFLPSFRWRLSGPEARDAQKSE